MKYKCYSDWYVPQSQTNQSTNKYVMVGVVCPDLYQIFDLYDIVLFVL